MVFTENLLWPNGRKIISEGRGKVRLGKARQVRARFFECLLNGYERQVSAGQGGARTGGARRGEAMQGEVFLEDGLDLDLIGLKRRY